MREITKRTEEFIRSVGQRLYVTDEWEIEEIVYKIEVEEKLDRVERRLIKCLIRTSELNRRFAPNQGYDLVVKELASFIH